MNCLRIVINQDKVNYRREEYHNNKITYPLPPFSTIIGALYGCCGYNSKDYIEKGCSNIKIGIVGKYDTINTEYKNDIMYYEKGSSFDRGILASSKVPNIFSPYIVEEVSAYSKKLKETKVFNKTKFDRIIELKNIKNKEDLEKIEYNKSIAYDTKPNHYQILYGVKLFIYIQVADEIMSDIIENINGLTHLGRSEDDVEIEDITIIDIKEPTNEVSCRYSSYIDYNLFVSDNIIEARREGIPGSGTKYHIGKTYTYDKKGKRVFDKKKVVYTSNFSVDEESEGVYVDNYKGEDLIINFN